MRLLYTVILLAAGFALRAADVLSSHLHYDYISARGTDSFAVGITLTNHYADYYLYPATYLPHMVVGVYEPNNKGKLLLKDTLKLLNIEETRPQVSPNISAQYNIQKLVFADTLVLPNSSAGYLLYHKEPLFFTGGGRAAAACYIPALAGSNAPAAHSSAGFYAMKAGETYTFGISATDADGDSLSYGFAPYYSCNLPGANAELPARLDSGKFFIPVSGKSYTELLLGGSLQLDAATGQVTAQATNPVAVAFGIEITEWRNGVPIAKQRRRVVLQSILRQYYNNAYVELWGTYGTAGVSLGWTHSLNGKERFYIERSIDNGPWQTIDSTLQTQYGFDKTRFADTVVRRYRIRALGDKNRVPVKVLSNQWQVGGKTALISAAETHAPLLKIYPNPATDYLFIELPPIGDAETKTAIYTATGTCVFTATYTGPVAVGTLPAGCYTLCIQGPAGTFVQKFIKQ